MGATHVILVTGATGTIGRLATQRLLTKGAEVRIFLRDATRVADLPSHGAQVFVGDLRDKDAVQKAFRGVSRALLFPCLDPPSLQIASVLAGALEQSSDLEGVVSLSSIGANAASASPILAWHGKADAQVESSGIVVHRLQPGYFLTNLFEVRDRIMNRGEIPNPFGQTAVPLIDPLRVAHTAADMLDAEDFSEGAMDFVDAWMTFEELAAVASETLRRRIVAVPAAWQELHPAFAHPATFSEIRTAGIDFCRLLREGQWGCDVLSSGNGRSATEEFFHRNRHVFA